jgi:hypothetical protein
VGEVAILQISDCIHALERSWTRVGSLKGSVPSSSGSAGTPNGMDVSSH